MGREKLCEKIKEIAEETLGAELGPSENLKESGVDSLGLVALVVGIEEEFGFSFSDDDLQPDKLRTMNDLITITEKYL